MTPTLCTSHPSHPSHAQRLPRISLHAHRPRITLSLIVAACALLGASAALAADVSKADYDSGKTRLSDTYKTEKRACDAFGGNAKDVCVEEAKAREKVGRADLEYSYTRKPADEIKTRVARAETAYTVAKEKCDDQAGNAKDVCRKQAKAVEVKALANPRVVQEAGAARAEGSADVNEANYEVAKEKCDASAGDAKDACLDAAKRRFGKQ